MLQRQGQVRRRHTAAAADPTPPVYDYGVRSRVLTCDGHPGTVLAVADGPYPGTESYDVRLDGGLGGGQYLAGQLQPLAAGHVAGTAAADYPALAQVLVEHPDPARSTGGFPASHTAAAEMSLGETIVPNRIPGPGPTKARSPMDNPASSGWASGPDPDQWSSAPLYPLDSRVGARGPEACDTCGGHMFARERGSNCSHCGLAGNDYGGHHADCCPEVQPCDHCGQALGEQAYSPCSVCGNRDPGHHAECCPHRGGGGDDDGDWDDDPDPGGVHAPRQRSEFGLAASLIEPEATLHEEPEAALPTTDGQVNADDADPEALTPSSFTAVLAAMRAANPDMDPARAGVRGGRGDSDVAAAARAHLAGLGKTSAYAFTPGQRRELIEEAPEALAANADRLDLTGTHYADMQQMMADGEEDDGSWLM